MAQDTIKEIIMAKPYWQITADLPPSTINMERIDTREEAMAKLHGAMENLEDDQTLTLYRVDANGFVHIEYKITRR